MILFSFHLLEFLCTDILFIIRKDENSEIYIGTDKEINVEQPSSQYIFEITESNKFDLEKSGRRKKLIQPPKSRNFLPLRYKDRQAFNKKVIRIDYETDEELYLAFKLVDAKVVLKTIFPYDLKEQFYITAKKISPGNTLEYCLSSRGLKLNPNKDIYELRLCITNKVDRQFIINLPQVYKKYLAIQSYIMRRNEEIYEQEIIAFQMEYFSM
ncbi:putative SP-containing protein [Vairimorpha necatrix]|uniref:SP-containing protein n=1 Tax=Vairimorpha necatrix TaxID=6039 RepID=A0AAX4JED2_9MICR